MGGGGRRGYTGEVVFVSGVCANALKVQICPKTLFMIVRTELLGKPDEELGTIL